MILPDLYQVIDNFDGIRVNQSIFSPDEIR